MQIRIECEINKEKGEVIIKAKVAKETVLEEAGELEALEKNISTLVKIIEDINIQITPDLTRGHQSFALGYLCCMNNNKMIEKEESESLIQAITYIATSHCLSFYGRGHKDVNIIKEV